MEAMSRASAGKVNVYVTNSKPGEVVQFYQNHSPQGEWKMTLNLTSPEKGGIIVWENGDYSAQVLIAVKEQQTVILLGWAPKFGSQATPAVPSFTKDDGLVASKVQVVTVAPDGSLWFGATGGLSHLTGENWRNYTKQEGLPNNNIISIFAAIDGKIWIGTPFDGVAVLDPSGKF